MRRAAHHLRTEKEIMETTHSNPFRSPGSSEPFMSSRWQKRVRKFHKLLCSDLFVDFIFPVSQAQIETALEFLDQNFGRWDGDESAAAWDYVLPALHKLFPQQRRFGFTSQFGPVRPARRGLVQWLGRCVLKQPDQVAAMAPG
jgi:hypothetical protein